MLFCEFQEEISPYEDDNGTYVVVVVSVVVVSVSVVIKTVLNAREREIEFVKMEWKISYLIVLSYSVV